MRLYKRFESKWEANEFADRMAKQGRLAMKQYHPRYGYYEVVYFMSKEDRNGDMPDYEEKEWL